MHLSLSLLAPELTRVQFLVFRVRRTTGMKVFKRQKKSIDTDTYSFRKIPIFRISKGSEKVYKFCHNRLEMGSSRNRRKNYSVWLFELSRCWNNYGFEKSWFYKIHYLTREFRVTLVPEVVLDFSSLEMREPRNGDRYYDILRDS